MRTHTILGEQMVADVSSLRDRGLGVVRSHHERWDGLGYPDRLAGDEIPLGARIFAVVDALDAMTTERPYRRATSWSDAVAEIKSEQGRQFDPTIVHAFDDVESDLRDIYHDLVAA
jgi:HD-GYP domain-containing protein (c-di-GMP phosphodiesterase class II)